MYALITIYMCNCSKRHSKEMIKKLETAGLGFYVRMTETQQTLGWLVGHFCKTFIKRYENYLLTMIPLELFRDRLRFLLIERRTIMWYPVCD